MKKPKITTKITAQLVGTSTEHINNRPLKKYAAKLSEIYCNKNITLLDSPKNCRGFWWASDRNILIRIPHRLIDVAEKTKHDYNINVLELFKNLPKFSRPKVIKYDELKLILGKCKNHDYIKISIAFFNPKLLKKFKRTIDLFGWRKKIILCHCVQKDRAMLLTCEQIQWLLMPIFPPEKGTKTQKLRLF